MALILLIALGFALAMFPTLRCAVFHPVSLVRFGVMDLLDHFKRPPVRLQLLFPPLSLRLRGAGGLYRPLW